MSHKISCGPPVIAAGQSVTNTAAHGGEEGEGEEEDSYNKCCTDCTIQSCPISQTSLENRAIKLLYVAPRVSGITTVP